MIQTLKQAKQNIPTILFGDLNTQPNTNGYNYITDVNMRTAIDDRVSEENHHFYELIEERMHSDLKGKFSSAFENYDVEKVQ